MKVDLFSAIVTLGFVLSPVISGNNQRNYIDLGPAYNVHMAGSSDYKLVDKWKKQPIFVEGFELLDDDTLL